MSGILLNATSGVTLIGGAEISPQDVAEACALAPEVVAADGGADRALAAGILPRLVIGDLDSIMPATRAELAADTVIGVAEQDTTDFEKCLDRIRAPFVIGIGFLGGRLDHALAALSVLGRAEQPVVLLGGEDVCFLAPLRLSLDLPVGSRLSLYPLAPVTGESRGLVWPIDGIDFAPDGRIGTSNRTDAPRVELSFSARRMLVLLPREVLRSALAALLPRGTPGAPCG